MNNPTPTTAISQTDKATAAPSGKQTIHSVSAPRYGAQASFSALVTDCITSLFAQPPTVKTLLLILALSLPATLAMMSTGLRSAEANLQANKNITVFLTDAGSSNAVQLADTLVATRHVHSAEVGQITLENKVLTTIDIHPVNTLDKAQFAFIAQELNSHTSVDYVVVDGTWFDRNDHAIGIAKKLRIGSIVVVALITSVLAYLFTRSDLVRQSSEARALVQMGASRRVTMMPIVLRCTLLTLFAGITAALIAWGIIVGLPAVIDISTYKGILPDTLPAAWLLSLLGIALLSSLLTVKNSLKNTIKS